MQIIDKCSESEYDTKGSNRTNQTIDQYELEVFPEIFLLEVIPSRKDHGRQQPIEKDLLIEIDLRDIVKVIQ